MPHVIRRSVTSLACVFAIASATARADDKGKLLIIGGGMTAAMAPEIYGKLADLLPEHGVVGYVPTAGETVKDPKSPDGRLAANLKGRTLKVIDLPADKPKNADDPAVAKAIETCDAIFFGGGAQSRIVKTFHPDGRDTLASRAVDAVLARGGVVAGTSAGAEIMSDPMIYMGDSDKALAKPDSLPIGGGMGYFKYGMVDQHFLQRGRFGRLCVALERTNNRFGFGISEARALLVDRATNTLTAIGPDAVVFLNRGRADGRKNWRVSLLGNGDVIDGKTGNVTPAPSRQMFVSIAGHTGAAPDVTDPWAKLAVGKLIHDVIGQFESGALIDKSQTLRFTIDDRTDVFGAAKDERDIGIHNLRLDIEPTPTGRVPATKPTTTANP